MTELRDYILSKLQERTKQGKIDFPKTTIMGKAARKSAAGALRAIKARYAQSGLAKAPGEAARATKEHIKRTYRLEGDPKPEPQRSSTDLRTHLAYVLADKLEELSQETMDSAAIKRTDMLRGGHRGREVPIYRGGTGRTDKPELIGTRTTAGTGVIQGRLQGRKATPDKPAKKSLYAGKITPGVTGKEGRAKFFAARAARREDSSTNLKDRMVDILMETYRSGYGSSRRRRETPREREERENYKYRDDYWSGRTDSQGNDAQNKIAPGGSDEGHKDSPEGHR